MKSHIFAGDRFLGALRNWIRSNGGPYPALNTGQGSWGDVTARVHVPEGTVLSIKDDGTVWLEFPGSVQLKTTE